jgi:mannose-6-phosphate isomerase-like protein (cupin superfamily)
MAGVAELLRLTGADKDARRVISEAMSTQGQQGTVRLTVIESEAGSDPLGQHYHDREEIFLLAKGSARLRLKNVATGEESAGVADAFTMIRIPAGVAHTFEPLSAITLISLTDCSYEELGTTRHPLV